MPTHSRQAAPGGYFGGSAARYDQSRPEYPDALIARIVAALPGPEVVDVGCGTGIEARQFQAAGCSVLGVDPDEKLARYARETGVEVEVAAFEDWDPGGRLFDAVVAGTAWHWVDPLAGAATAARVLRPGGVLAPFHHSAHTPDWLIEILGGSSLPAWPTRSAQAYRKVAPITDRDPTGRRRPAMELYQPMFDLMVEGICQTGGFTGPEQWRFEWGRTYSREQWLEVVGTQTALASRSPDELARLLAATGDAIDALGGHCAMPYTTVAVVAVRTDA